MNILDNSLPISSLFTFILIIGGNYIGELLPCRLQKVLKTNMVFKHLLGFLTLIFFVQFSDKQNSSLEKLVKQAIVLYIWFALIIKMNTQMFVILSAVLSIMFIIKLYKEQELKKTPHKNFDKLNNIYNGMFVISILITLYGFIMYWREKEITFGKAFDIGTFLFGPKEC
jgi:hypothetical protein